MSREKAIDSTLPTKNGFPASPDAAVDSQPKSSSDSAAQLTDQTNLLPTPQVIICFLVLGLATLVSVLDSVIVSTSLSTISSAFNAGGISSWVPSAYMLTSTCFQPLTGRFSDIFGRRTVLITAMLMLLVGNLAAGFSRNIIQLIVLRGLAGAGGGSISGLTQIIMSDVVSLRERGKFQGIIGVIVTLGFALGPLLGGVLVEKTIWRWCFWITVPMTFLSICVIISYLPLKPVLGNMKTKLLLVDYTGSGLTLVASTLTMLPLIWGGITFPWDSAIVLGTLISSIFAWGFFIIWESKGARLPLVPMHVFGHSTVSGVCITTFITGFVTTSVTYYLPQFFQIGLQYSPIHSGIFLMPIFTPQMLANQLAGLFMSKTGRYRSIIYTGYIILSVSSGLISMINAYTHQSVMVVYMLFFGIGAGLTYQSSLVAAQASVERKNMSVVTSFRNFVRLLGSALALATGSALINNTLRSSMQALSIDQNVIKQVIDDPLILSRPAAINLTVQQATTILRDGYTKGFHHVLILDAALAAAATVATVVMIKHKNLRRDDDDKFRVQGMTSSTDKVRSEPLDEEILK